MPGNVYSRMVAINEVTGSNVRRLAFRKDHFTFDEVELEQRIPNDLGYAGFELSYSLGQPNIDDKFLVFAGGSYFRGIGKGGQWGLSVRGAAMNTGLASGEEFPDFVEFWLVRPQPRARRMTVYALLNSPRLTGAYEFLISPGASTRLDIRTVLFTRDRIEQLGIAALTSLYFYGENTPRSHAPGDQRCTTPTGSCRGWIGRLDLATTCRTRRRVTFHNFSGRQRIRAAAAGHALRIL